MRILRTIKTKIKNDALTRLKERKIEERANMHLFSEVLEVGQKIKSGPRKEVVIARKTALVYVDLAPEFNWAHPTEYLLYDAESGDLQQKIEASFPPAIIGAKTLKVESFHTPVKIAESIEREIIKKKTLNSPNQMNSPYFPYFPFPLFPLTTGNRYAILFSGHSSRRHVNDLEFLYRTLIDIYGFDPANIFVHNHDGTLNYFLDLQAPHQADTIRSNAFGWTLGKWPGNNTDYRIVINGPGTSASLQTTLNTLAKRLQNNDLLLIHTNNHGGGPGDGVDDYCMFEHTTDASWVGYMVDDFITDLSVLPAFQELMVMMEQCRSGGFVDPIIDHSPAARTHVSTAVQPNYYSLGETTASPFFDSFAKQWIAALAGKYPDGSALKMTVDTDNNGLVSAAEAFTYADTLHELGDTPMSADSPNGCGSSIYLGISQIMMQFPLYPQYLIPFPWYIPIPPGDPISEIASILKEGDERKQFYKTIADYRLALISAHLEVPRQSPLTIKQLKAAEEFFKSLQKLFST